MTMPPPIVPGPEQPYQLGQIMPAPPRKKSNVGLIIGIVVAVVLVLCGGTAAVVIALGDAAVDEASRQVDAAASKATSPCDAGLCSSSGASAPTTAPAGGDEPIKFGAGKWTYTDGISVQVNSVKKWKVPSINAGHTPGNSAVKVQVTLHNGTGENFDCTLADVEVSMGAEGVQADQVFADGVDECQGSIAPGRKKTFTVGFSAPTKDLSVIQVEVTPSWDHEAGIFEGKPA